MDIYSKRNNDFKFNQQSPMAYMEAQIEHHSTIRKVMPHPVATSIHNRAMKVFRFISTKDKSRNGFIPCDVSLTQYGVEIVDRQHIGCHYAFEEDQTSITIYWDDYSISTARADIPETFNSQEHTIEIINDKTLLITCTKKLFKLHLYF